MARVAAHEYFFQSDTYSGHILRNYFDTVIHKTEDYSSDGTIYIVIETSVVKWRDTEIESKVGFFLNILVFHNQRKSLLLHCWNLRMCTSALRISAGDGGSWE